MSIPTDNLKTKEPSVAVGRKPNPEKAEARPGHLKFKLMIAYDGTRYQGWQTQKIGVGVQQHVEAAVRRLFPNATGVRGSSRTDTGVHALGMVAHVEIPRTEWMMKTRKLAL